MMEINATQTTSTTVAGYGYINSTEYPFLNTTLSDVVPIEKAGYWTLKDYLVVAALIVICAVASFLFTIGKAFLKGLFPKLFQNYDTRDAIEAYLAEEGQPQGSHSNRGEQGNIIDIFW